MALGYDTVPATASAGRALRTIIDAPSFRALDAGTQHDLAAAVDKVAGYLEADPAQTLGLPVAGQLAGFDTIRQRQQAGAGYRPPAPSNGARAQQPAPAPAPAGQPAPGGTSATGRVGEVARATLNAIDFPQFVAALIQGTFKAIVDASIQQMEAYAALLKNVAGTVDRYMDDNVTEGMAKDHLAEEHPWLFNRDTARGRPELTVNQSAPRELPSFLKDMGFNSPRELNKNTLQEVVIPATRKTLAETRQQTLATMVLMGMNRVVVDDGEIKAKLMFHIDASETTAMKFDQQKATTGNFAIPEQGVNGQFLMVNTASINAQSDLNVRADLTGEVRVKFRSETFPLERFADSAAIQLINSNAKVPERPAPAPPAGAAPPASQMPPPPPLPPTIASPLPAQPPPPPAPEPAPAPPATGQQGLESDDPWMPA